MVFKSRAVITMFTLTVLLIVFYFDPTQTVETVLQYDTCELCIESPCHKSGHACACGSGGNSLCFKCDKRTPDDDQQFYTQSGCEAKCADKSKCTCDYACWVCVEKGNPASMQCTHLSTMFDDSCNVVPYVPKKDK
ncbi:uncharacterized protein LOC113551047 [Rhopalosiphum maidis]|uniref:uncharacterized protein LOC113551047 n=1 Tax=Rhopalosiphum maidis TaxID=43146 RepID=UPI000F0008CF|nr:uncharacterized protein LOC113551047 [Rhopalosiphum maidis]